MIGTLLRRMVLGPFLALALLVPGVVAAPAVASDDVTLDTHPLTLTAVADEGPGDHESAPVDARFTMFALTWDGEGPAEAWYRIDPGDGTWTGWEPLIVESDDVPDATAGEASSGRAGTDLLYVGPGDRLQVRVSGAGQGNMEAVMVDTSTPGDDGTPPPAGPFDPSAAGSMPAKPPIHPRSEWDPTNRCVPRRTPEEIQVTTAIVHHTGGTNAYRRRDVSRMILGYCLYHRNALGWDDIAYNFLVDRFGGIWEGRAGGVEMGIRGGHAKGFSHYSTGIAMIGNFTSASPPAVEETALEHLLAWKLAVHNLDPLGTTSVISLGSYKIPEDVRVTLGTIIGHRDVQSTACPGSRAYSLIPRIRTDVAGLWTPPPADAYAHPVVGDFDGDGAEEGAVYRKATGTWWLYDDGAVTAALDGADGVAVDGAVAADVDGDGDDEIVVLSGNAVTVLDRSGAGLTGTAAGTLGSGSGWRMGVGDVTGDGPEGVVFVEGGGAAWVLTGGTVAAWGSIGGSHPFMMVGDFDGDGRADAAGFRDDGSVDVALSDGASFAGPTVWGDAGPSGGWRFVLSGDFDGNGRADVAAFRSSTNTWYGLRSNGSRLVAGTPVVTPTKDHWSEAFVFDYRGDGRDEVISLDAHYGTWHLGQFGVGHPFFTLLEDAPYRTTVERNDAGSGITFLTWFGQEFAWVATEMGRANGTESEPAVRLYGPTRYETAALLSGTAFLSSDTVFVATGADFPDALAGGPAAILDDAPVLLTERNSLPTATRNEIGRLHPRRIVLLGGEAAISAGVEQQLVPLAAEGVTRIGGADRYETAALISQAFFTPDVETVYVATGSNFPDALAGVPAAGGAGGPMLLVQRNSLPAVTAAEIDRLAPREIVLLGGSATVGDAVARELGAHAPSVRRLSGADRYETGAAVSKETFPTGAGMAILAVGTNFPDAVAAGPAAAHLGVPLLLSAPHTMTPPTLRELRRLRLGSVVILGSTRIVAKAAADELNGPVGASMTGRVANLPRP